jgi:hypothetical protein
VKASHHGRIAFTTTSTTYPLPHFSLSSLLLNKPTLSFSPVFPNSTSARSFGAFLSLLQKKKKRISQSVYCPVTISGFNYPLLQEKKKEEEDRVSNG